MLDWVTEVVWFMQMLLINMISIKVIFYAFDGGLDQSGNLLLSPTKVNNERHQLLFTIGVHF